MNVKSLNLLKDNKNNDYLKNKYNTIQHINKKKINSNTNNFQSDKKVKNTFSPYYNNHHKKIGSDAPSKDNQNNLLQKRELEIKDLKMKCQKLEQENHRYQIQNILLKNNFIINNKKNNNTNINNNHNILPNNTSSNFPIKSEIKKIWENLAKVEILNNFIEFENQPKIIYHLICELFLLSNKMIKEHCLSKYEEIIKIMGIKNNSVIIKDIETQFKTFMKEHLDEIFNYLQDKSFINEYKKQFKDIVKKNIISIKEDNIQLFEDILEQYEFNEMLKNINDLILFSNFNEPTLYFKIENKYEKRKISSLKINNENKKKYIIINDQGNSNISLNAIILLNPPCLKSGISFYNELKPIIMSIGKEIEEELNNNSENEKFQLDNYINNKKCINKNQYLCAKNYKNYEKNKDLNYKEIKYNSINNLSRINRNLRLETIQNNKDNDYNYMNFYTYDYDNNDNNFINIDKNNINQKFCTIERGSFLEENKKLKKLILINSPRYSRKSSKRIKNLSLSKDINNDINSADNEIYFKNKNFVENKKFNTHRKIIFNLPLNKKNNKIHRIKSENNYFYRSNNSQVNKKKIIKQKTYFKNNDEINIIFNKYKKYLSNNNYNSKKYLIVNSSDENQSTSKQKIYKTPINFRKNKRNKINKKYNKNYYITSNNKSNMTSKNNNRRENKINIKYNQKYSNDKFLKNNKTKENLKLNNNLYKNSFLLINKKRNNNIISPSKSRRQNKNNKKFKENIINVIDKNKKMNLSKNLTSHNNIKIKRQNIKKNYSNFNSKSNRNILNTNNLNTNFSNLSHNRNKKNEKRIESFDQKNSIFYSAFEEIKRMIDDNHKPIIMITTNSNINNNTININKQLAIKRQNFSRKIKKRIKKNKYNTINNSIKQLNCFPQKKNTENGNINNNIGNIDNNNNKNKHSIIKNNYIYNIGSNIKQFSVDETTFNTSNQFNLTHDYNNKSNNKNKNYNLNFKISKNKENTTLYNEAIKSKSNNNSNTIKNRIKEIEINIDGLNNNNKKFNYNTIETRSTKNRYHKIFNITENKKHE